MKPIFEIFNEDDHFKIYENGTISGFRDDYKIINRIPVVFAERMAEILNKLDNG